MITWIDHLNGTMNESLVEGKMWVDYGKDKTDYSFNLEGRTLMDADEVFVSPFSIYTV